LAPHCIHCPLTNSLPGLQDDAEQFVEPAVIRFILVAPELVVQEQVYKEVDPALLIEPVGQALHCDDALSK
jgi:hypothetical protein